MRVDKMREAVLKKIYTIIIIKKKLRKVELTTNKQTDTHNHHNQHQPIQSHYKERFPNFCTT